MIRLSDAQLPWLHRSIFWLGLVGLFASLYLLIVYVTGGPITCGVSEGCDVVRGSSYAWVWGKIPRPALGVVFYLIVLSLIVARTGFIPSTWQKKAYGMQQFVAVVGFLESAWLFWIQWKVIEAFCTWCLVSGAVTVGLVLLAICDRPWDSKPTDVRRDLQFLFGSVVVAFLLGMVALGFLTTTSSESETPAPIESTRLADPKVMTILVPTSTSALGPATSTLTVIEFLDLQCPACRIFHPTMQKIRDAYKDRVRFVTRVYPLVEIHAQAKGAAIAWVCADRQGAGTRYVDYVLPRQAKLQKEDLVGYAKDLRLNIPVFETCLTDSTSAERVVQDRLDGQSVGVQSTPTLFLNDEMLTGLPDEKLFRQLIEERL